MAIIIKNEYGHYIKHNECGELVRVKDESEAEDFRTLGDAIAVCKLYPNKTSGYYVYDTYTRRTCYIARSVPNKKKIRRKHWHEKDKRLIYDNAQGRCALCGRMIEFREMSLDHIVPLSQGGKDVMDNLQCTCCSCNQFKQSILPEEFYNRITEIFLYQMEKNYGHVMKWKIVRRLLVGMI